MQQIGIQVKDNKRVFLEGLMKYQRRGIPIFIDGRKAGERQLEQILREDKKGFYMGDYVLEENPDYQEGRVRELGSGYSADSDTRRFRLKEIRFDKVYHQ